MRSSWTILAPVLAVLCGGAQAESPAASGCSLALAFALDISTSVDAAEYELQREGLAGALLDDEVRALILAHPGAVMLMTYEWSGDNQQATIAPWSAIANEGDLAHFANSLLGHSRMNDDYPTALGAAIGFGATRLNKVSSCARLVLDISGDGANNHGYPPSSAYRHFPAAGITVNGLVIDTGDTSVIDYYLEQVIHGPGAFVEIALGFGDYERAMKRKLLREIPPPQFAQR